jgi:DNA-binding transcriptional MerR regulator
MAVTSETRYNVDELADLGGVSRRTVRFYLREGLLPAPLGVGRGPHYNDEHLRRLLRLRELQEQGLTLAAIQAVLTKGRGPAAAAAPKRSAYVRLELAPGLELHVASDIRLPPPGRLAELAVWCREWFRQEGAREKP